MKNEARKFDHEVFGKLQVVVYEDKPHFIANEVCKILEYTNPSKAVKDHCKYLIKLNYNDSLELKIEQTSIKGVQLLPEKDVYRLIMRSKMEKAEEFQDWVMEEVLPTIRKTGGFVSEVDQIIDTYYKDEKEDIKAIIRSSLVFRKENQHKIDFANDVTDTVGWQDMNSVAKVLGLGRNTLFGYLRKIGVLMENNSPYQQYIIQGYFKVNPVTKYGKQYNVTLVSGKGEVWIHKKLKEHKII